MNEANQGNTRVPACPDSNTTGQGQTSRNRKSGDKMATHSKSDIRYWKGKLFKHGHTKAGVRSYDSFWSIRIAHAGRRGQFNLSTPNAETAAAKAQRIYQKVLGAGWDAAIAEFKPASVPKPTPPAKPATLGEWLAALEASGTFKPQTLNCYAQSIRQIAAGIADIGDQPALDENGTPRRDRKRRPVLLSRNDVHRGGRAAWVAAVETLGLDIFTAEAVGAWTKEYIKAVGAAPDARRRALTTSATLIRCARSLFTSRATKAAGDSLMLPKPAPFSGIKLPEKANATYRSKIDAPDLIAAAQRELTGEPLKIFFLAVLSGLRKKEIDLLQWSQVDLKKRVLRIERTDVFEPKSEKSCGEIDLDPEAVALLSDWKSASTGKYVIEGNDKHRPSLTRHSYRAKKHFEEIYSWLRGQGISAQKPLHELRKELGAVLASSLGIYAAQSVLRHAQITTTAAHYADKKVRFSAGFGAFIVPKAPPEAEK